MSPGVEFALSNLELDEEDEKRARHIWLVIWYFLFILINKWYFTGLIYTKLKNFKYFLFFIYDHNFLFFN